MTHTRVPQPFTVSEPLDYEDAREALRELGNRRQRARETLEDQTKELVDAERDYRKARAHARVTTEAKTAADRKEEIDGKTADDRHKRDGAEWAVKITQEKLAEIDAQRASVHRLVDWASRLDPLGAQNAGQRAA